MTAPIRESELASFAAYFGDRLSAVVDEYIAGVKACEPGARETLRRRLEIVTDAFCKASGELNPAWPGKVRRALRGAVHEIGEQAFYRALSEASRERAWAGAASG